ncbi:uncharacterized protein SPAPADRAFT_58265 [Spathaspora passalidarum NRRL Y-27907]|uniref:Oxidoreductase-like domain-containing protein n=1 Tax=Spathaspora passalidarum (strain NRRL Y-27907 / 11-Y1) TaxID=619300 RepID=G3AFX3_SPAPN|nr:uncharacterized protein SPAPADRAFT_58265 [Spathaspora passalidarum NRRL Y-27907]EGW35112.1 hypothetical protein SPAPADRAFT_58265 [Spathaspora passalidarum NRRL Y-27907]
MSVGLRPAKRAVAAAAAQAPSFRASNHRYAFYDLILRTSSHPTHPIEASLMTSNELARLKARTKTTFEGNYYIDPSLTPEQRIAKVFGGRIKGEGRESSSRITRGEPKVIAGVTVPAKPDEPDNCCMSGCINCVWELFDEDIKDWNEKRKRAAKLLVKQGGRWPEDFDAPLKYLGKENLPVSLLNKPSLYEAKQKALASSDEEESWGNVPVAMRVFAEVEKKLKAKKLARISHSEPTLQPQESKQSQASSSSAV